MSDPIKYDTAYGMVTFPEGEGFSWSAWGPGEAEGGHAATEEVARALAQIALDRMRKPKLRLVE
jgi:hypothetical protein